MADLSMRLRKQAQENRDYGWSTNSNAILLEAADALDVAEVAASREKIEMLERTIERLRKRLREPAAQHTNDPAPLTYEERDHALG